MMREGSFDSLPLLLFQFSCVWRQSFAIGVSDLYFFSPSFSIFDNWASISSDKSPCRYSFELRGTHVFSICTDFPRYHRMESLTQITCIEFRSIIVSKSDREQISVIQYCVMSASHSKVVVDHEGDLSSSWKTDPLSGLSVPRD